MYFVKVWVLGPVIDRDLVKRNSLWRVSIKTMVGTAEEAVQIKRYHEKMKRFSTHVQIFKLKVDTEPDPELVLASLC